MPINLSVAIGDLKMRMKRRGSVDISSVQGRQLQRQTETFWVAKDDTVDLSLTEEDEMRRRESKQRPLEETPLSVLAKTHFRLPTPPQFARKELKQPLLKATPESEKNAALRIWRVLLKFMGDVVDQKPGSDPEQQAGPVLASVMTRLYQEMGLVTSDTNRKLRHTPHIDSIPGEDGASPAPAPGPAVTLPPPRRSRGAGGTLSRLRAGLSARLWGPRAPLVEALSVLALDETLCTPLEQVHFIVGHGILKAQLRDEIYCQVCRQLVRNPNKSSAARGWLLLTLITGCFPPTHQVLPTFRQFVDDAPLYYASLLSKLLQRTLANGTRFQPPALPELQAALQKKPVDVQVTLMDGTTYILPIDGATTAAELKAEVTRHVGLKHNFGFSLYIAMCDKVAALSDVTDHVLDAVSQCEQLYRDQSGLEDSAPWRLFYRKEVFSPWDDLGGDPVGINLVFAQLTRGLMMGEYRCEQDQEMAVLAAQQYYIEYGDEINEDALRIVLPSIIPREKSQDEDSAKLWRRGVLKIFNKFFHSGNASRGGALPTADKVKLDLIGFCKRKWAHQFSRYYDVVKIEGPDWGNCGDHVRLAVNSTGIYVISADNVRLMEIPFTDLFSVTAKGLGLLLVLTSGACLKLQTPDAADARRLVAYLTDGLRRRSVWAVSQEDVPGVSSGELAVQEGDLLQLEFPAAEGALSHPECRARNLRTARVGHMPSSLVYILPVTGKPSDSVLKQFRSKRIKLPENYTFDLTADTFDTTHINPDLDDVTGEHRHRTLNKGHVSNHNADVILTSNHVVSDESMQNSINKLNDVTTTGGGAGLEADLNGNPATEEYSPGGVDVRGSPKAMSTRSDSSDSAVSAGTASSLSTSSSRQGAALSLSVLVHRDADIDVIGVHDDVTTQSVLSDDSEESGFNSRL